jgi:MFS family permease
MGYLFSGFSWAYVLGQLPAGGLLDRFGSKRVYGISILPVVDLRLPDWVRGLPGRKRRIHGDLRP